MSARKLLANKQNLTFGPYRLRTREGVLERDGQPLAISEKTLEVLCVLLENPGELVERETFKQKVWPGIFVEDTNISFQISILRKLLEENANAPQFIATVPKRGYRFIAEVAEEQESSGLSGSTQIEQSQLGIESSDKSAPAVPSSRTVWIGGGILIVFVFALMAWTGSRSLSVTALTEKGAVILADFANKTGEPVFDGTLRQGLLVELEQSPFLSLLSEQRVQQSLRLMRRPGALLTHEVAMEICERTGSTLMVEGSIERVGGLYILGLRAMSCEGGRLLAAEQAKAPNREGVLDALSTMAARFRRRIGETTATLQRHNTSLAEATTTSLEALQAYTIGWHVHMTRGAAEAIPLLRHAVELDPEFALAYAALGRMYADIDESDQSAESLQRAWDLKEHASDRKRFFIMANYLSLVKGNLEEARKVAEAWARTYPREATPHTLLSGILNKAAARYEEAASHASRAIQLDPDFGMSYYNLAVNRLYLQHLDQATSTLAKAEKRGLNIEEFQMLEYDLAFLRQDHKTIRRIVSQARQSPNPVSWLANREAFRVAYTGQLRQARSISEQAIAEAERTGERERAAVWEAGMALREAMSGNIPLARKSAFAALQWSNDREVEYGAGLALALIGESKKAETVVNTLEHRFPEDTTVRFTYLPVLRAQIELNHNRPELAVEALKLTIPTEMGVSRSPVNTLFGALYPIYFRGLAYCAWGRGKEAAAEFQKIITHSGLVITDPVGVLAYVQLGRAYRLAGNQIEAKTSYEEFFRLWNDADTDIPLLRTARAEYQRIRI